MVVAWRPIVGTTRTHGLLFFSKFLLQKKILSSKIYILFMHEHLPSYGAICLFPGQKHQKYCEICFSAIFFLFCDCVCKFTSPSKHVPLPPLFLMWGRCIFLTIFNVRKIHFHCRKNTKHPFPPPPTIF